jgi:hypothetical protein
MMMSAKPLLVVALLLGTATTIAATAADAQARRVSVIPAETPPASFSGSQYVDSRGCVFVRAGSNGQTTWVPRFGADRQPVCGFAPTSAGAAQDQAQVRPAAPETPAPATLPVEPPRAPAPELIVTAPPAGVVRIARPADSGPQIIAGTPLADPTTATPNPATATARATSPRRTEPARVALRPTPPAQTAAANVPHPQPPHSPAHPQGDGEWVVWDGSSPAPLGGNRVWVPRGQASLTVVPPPSGQAAPRPAQTAAAPRQARRPADGISPFAVPAADPWGWSAAPMPRLRGAPHAAATPSPLHPAASRGAAGQFVQVGAYAVPSNAARTQAQLRDHGLPVAVSRARQGGRDLALVMTGPFASADEVLAALTTARRMGFRDAYIR